MISGILDDALALIAIEHPRVAPVSGLNGAPKRSVHISKKGDGKIERRFEINLADEEPDWWGSLDVTDWHGETLGITIDKIRSDSRGLTQVVSSAEPLGRENWRGGLSKDSHRCAPAPIR